MPDEKLVPLTPDQILLRDNVRFGLKPYRIDSLAEDILGYGGVHTPITVEKLKTAIDGKDYALVFGAYRHASVDKLNREQKAGLTLPARVIQELSDAERLRLQVSENNERENMSPMDKAITIAKMISAGLSKMDIRKAFAAPGGRKGIKVAPASNAHINMLTSFLDFPKDIQKKIHDGVLGMGAAYELTKYPRDKWDGILARAETERQKALDREDKDETVYLENSKKAEEATQEQQKAAQTLAQAQELVEKTAEVVKEKAASVTAALQVQLVAKGEEKKKATEAFKSVTAELKSAQDVADKAAKELAKIEDKAKTAGDKAAAAKARLEEARSAKASKAAQKVTGKDVKKAAKEENVTDKAVKLNATEMRDAVKTLTINGKAKTKAVGALLLECFDGKITDGQLELGVARLLGEAPAAAPTPTPAAKKK